MITPVCPTKCRAVLALIFAFLSFSDLQARMMDNGVDPANLGKGEWIYILPDAIDGMNGRVPSINSIPTMMTYLTNQGVHHIIVKAGTGSEEFPSASNPQFTASLVNAAHAVGIKIFGYTRSNGTNVPGEIALAAKCYNLGADGFVIDAEAEWESSSPNNMVGTNGPALALQLGSGIKAQFPNKFLGHSPFPYISFHSSFPYRQFGLYCDAVMPQAYWNDISLVNCSPTKMVEDMSTQWRNWHNSLSGNWTNAIKPICPVAGSWNADCNVTGDQMREFVTALKNDPNPPTKHGYRGLNYFRAELQSTDVWSGIRDADIGTAPKILVQPKALIVTNVTPTNVTMAVEAVGGIPLRYQWRLNGVTMPGATDWNYVISNVQFTNGGTYSVVVSNYLGSVTSANATLTVRARPQITVQPLSQSVVISNNANFTVTANGTTPLSYQWKFNGANITGATTSSYTRSNSAFTNAGNYTVVITNLYGAITSSVAALTVVASSSPPVITTQPQGKTLLVGTNITLSITATGTSPLFYQWRLNGTNVAGATKSTLNLTNLQPAHAGAYTITVTNSVGGDTSLDANVAVNYALNLVIVGGGTVTKSSTADSFPAGTSVTLTASGGFTGWSGDASGAVNPLNVTMDGHKTITASFVEEFIVDSTEATVVNSANWSTGSSPTPWNGNYRYKAPGTGSLYLQFTPNLPYTGSYQVSSWHVPGGNRTTAAPHVVNYNNGSTTNTINQEINGNQWNTVGNFNFNAGTSGNVRITDGFSEASNVVMADGVRWVFRSLPVVTTPPQSQTVLIGSNATFGVEASRHASYQWRLSGTNITGATGSTYTRTNVQPAHAGNYTVRLTGANGSVNSAAAVLTVVTLPSISTPPQSQSVNAGGSALFEVSAEGTGTLSFQWRRNGVNIPGATTSAYTRSDIQSGDSGEYNVVVRNSYGAAVSANAVLTVIAPPSITAHPQDQTVNPGASAIFNVAATGSGSLTYQWQYNGTNIGGATATSYTVTDAQQSKAGFYRALVSNSAGTTPSDTASLTVNAPPSITDHPESKDVYPGTAINFTVAASGMEPLFYQWYFNNSLIPNATNNVLPKVSVQSPDAGNYFVVVSNALGSVPSQPATLTLKAAQFEAPTILPDNKIQLVFNDQPGVTNIIQGSDDLVGWFPISTNVNTDGTLQFIESLTNAPHRFYRAIRAP